MYSKEHTLRCADLICWNLSTSIISSQRHLPSCTQSRRLVWRKGASWRLNWPSGANLLAHVQLKCILYAPL